MKTIARIVIIALGTAGLAGCASHSKPAAATGEPAPAVATPAATNALDGDKARFSYAIGMTLGHSFQVQGVEADTAILSRGINDVLSGGKTLLTQQEMQQTLNELQKNLMAKAQKMREVAGITNKAEGEAFFATNKNNPGVITLPSGLQYVVITNGSGVVPAAGDLVKVIYRGTLLDGTVFDDSQGHPRQMSMTGIIPGWAEALSHMNVGSKWKLFIPSPLGYGETGRPPRIMPNSSLIFDVELVDTEHPRPPEPLTSDIVKVPSLDEMKKGAKVEIIKSEDAAKVQAAQTPPPATNSPAK
jgi:FKBP-type peptidyl-prolyl cis-trans isomerase